MSKYLGSKRIENEVQRLSLLSSIANNDLLKVLNSFILKKDKEYTILDIGCGTGESFTVFDKVFPKRKLVGIDLSKNALEVASNRKLADELILADLEDINNNERIRDLVPFDIIYIRNTLIHILEPGNILKKVKKLCIPDTHLIIQEGNWETAQGNFATFDILKNSIYIQPYY